MKRVLIIKNWNHPDIFRQSKDGYGTWDGIKFTENQNEEYDYVFVLGLPKKNIKVHTYKKNIWFVQQEPPNEFFKYFQPKSKIYSRIFTTDTSLKEERYVYSQPAIPWFVDKTYKELKKDTIPNKRYNLSWVTSFKKNFIGHKKRLEFLKKIKASGTPVDIIATTDYYHRQNKTNPQNGFAKAVENKWEGLAPYKYSLIVENFQGSYYWSEKLADCFLSFTFPIYYGCTNITDFFPQQSLVQIDMDDTTVFEKIKSICESNLWEKNIQNIIKARELVLEKYQLFPYFSDQIKKWEKLNKGKKQEKETVIIPREDTLVKRIVYRLKRYLD